MIPAQNLQQRLADGPQIEFVDLPGACALRSNRRLINLRAQGEFASARRSDTPTHFCKRCSSRCSGLPLVRFGKHDPFTDSE
jgi:hypothetical protein